MIRSVNFLVCTFGFFVVFLLCFIQINGDQFEEGRAKVMHSYNFQVAIRKQQSIVCSGLIYNERTIVTVAKCVHKRNKDQLSILAGTLNLNEDGESRSVSDVIIHPQFKIKTMKNDIALLILKEPLTFSIDIQPANFYTEENITEQFVDLSGWGATEKDGPGKYPDQMYEVTVKTISNDKCQEMWNLKNMTIYPTQVCTYVDHLIIPKGVCDGDDGGPVISWKARIIGLISYYPNPCASGLPDVHTRIQPYLKWIKENSVSS